MGEEGDSVGRRQRLLQKALESLEQRLDSDDIRGTLADLIRLLQLEKELTDAEREQPREIRVRWVESDKETSVTKR